MIPNIHQSINEIINEASPTQKVLWQQIRLLTGENATVRQLVYGGNLVGSELQTGGAPRRIYIANQIILSHALAGVAATDMVFRINDGLGGIIYAREISLAWNTTAAALQWFGLTTILRDISIFQITVDFGGAISQVHFNGYRITY